MILEWLEHINWVMGLFIVFLTYVSTAATSGGKLGKWIKGRWNRRVYDKIDDINDDMVKFMNDHSSCKSDTNKRLEKIENRLKKVEDYQEDNTKKRDNDLKRFKLMYRLHEAQLEHIIRGNHVEECKRLKEELYAQLIEL